MPKLYDIINPSLKQREALEAIKQFKYVFYGGAKGGGKSYFLRWAMIRLLIWWHKQGIDNVRVGLFCEDYPSLKDRQITKIKREFPKKLGELKDDSIEGLSFLMDKRYGGGIIALRNLDDPSKYSSSEFAAIGVDELERNKEEVFTELRSILRWPKLKETRFVGTGMPGGIGHGWVKKYWIDRDFPKWETEQEQFKFIQAKASDNAHIEQSYLDQLKSLPEKVRKAYLDGDWDIFSGQYFTEWSKEKHVVAPFVIPDGWMKYRAYDHGRESPACCLWFAVDYDGKVWCYREFYQSGQNVDQIAETINLLSGNESYQMSVADPSIFHNSGFVDKYGGQTIAETFARHGIAFYPASNRRVDGWNIMHQYLAQNDTMKPKLVFFETCFNSIRTIPIQIHSINKPEDMDSNGDDHAADAVRYFLMSLHEATTSRPLTEVERKLNEIKNRDNNAYLSFDADY